MADQDNPPVEKCTTGTESCDFRSPAIRKIRSWCRKRPVAFRVIVGLMGCYAFVPALILLEGRLPLLRLIVLYMHALWIVFWLSWAARAYENPRLRKRGQRAARILFILVSIVVGIGLGKELLNYLLLH